MAGNKIQKLQDGLWFFVGDLQQDKRAAISVEVAVITFDDEARLVQDFAPAKEFGLRQPLEASGQTHLGTAIGSALDLVRDRKAVYSKNGISHLRPWILMITDGHPEGEDPSLVKQAALRLAQEQKDNKVIFYAVGLDQADMERLKEISVATQPYQLETLDFKSLFKWLSDSLSGESRTQVGKQTPLPDSIKLR